MRNMILIYDDNCPFCNWYSRQFVRFGFLTETGRQAFSKVESTLLNQIDFEKSRNEIPLIDTTTGTVFYGIDALLEILGQKIPFIKNFGNFVPIKWFLKKLYKLISYNRKVIVAKKCGPGNIDCSPDMNYFYRIFLMINGLLISTVMLFLLHKNIFTLLSYYNLSLHNLLVVHFSFVSFNWILALSLKKEKAVEFLGQINALAFITILLVIPLFILAPLNLPEWIFTSYLLLTAAIIFKEYIRRMDYAGFLLNNKCLISLNLLSLIVFLLFLFH